MRARLFPAAVAAIALGVATPAHAQCTVRWQPGLFGGPGSTVPVCDQGASAAQPKAKVPTAKQRKRTPTRAHLRTLRFTPRATVSTEVFERLVARFSHEGGPDAVRAELQRVAPMTQTRRSLKALKFSSRDLGDAYSHAFIVLWTVVNGRPVVSEKSVKGVRADLRAQLALEPEGPAGVRRAAAGRGRVAGLLGRDHGVLLERAGAERRRGRGRRLARAGPRPGAPSATSSGWTSRRSSSRPAASRGASGTRRGRPLRATSAKRSRCYGVVVLNVNTSVLL